MKNLKDNEMIMWHGVKSLFFGIVFLRCLRPLVAVKSAYHRYMMQNNRVYRLVSKMTGKRTFKQVIGIDHQITWISCQKWLNDSRFVDTDTAFSWVGSFAEPPVVQKYQDRHYFPAEKQCNAEGLIEVVSVHGEIKGALEHVVEEVEQEAVSGELMQIDSNVVNINAQKKQTAWDAWMQEEAENGMEVPPSFMSEESMIGDAR